MDIADGENWAHEMAGLLPVRSREFAAEVGPALLGRTADARAAVKGYLKAFGTLDWKELWTKLEPRATTNEIREAERIARTPPTIQVYEGFPLYRAVVLGIMLYGDQAEGKQVAPKGVEPWPTWDPWAKVVDWSKWGLAWRIEMLADRMLGRYPEVIPRTLPGEEGE
jgi:hypothetical protein